MARFEYSEVTLVVEVVDEEADDAPLKEQKEQKPDDDDIYQKNKENVYKFVELLVFIMLFPKHVYNEW
jgi:hypothetical protein